MAYGRAGCDRLLQGDKTADSVVAVVAHLGCECFGALVFTGLYSHLVPRKYKASNGAP